MISHPSTFYDAVNADETRPAAKRKSLYPGPQEYRNRLAQRTRLATEAQQNKRESDYLDSVAGKASSTYNVSGTFPLANRDAEASQSKYADQGLAFVILPSLQKTRGGYLGGRNSSELDRSIARSASLPGPLEYRVNDLFGKLKHGPRMVPSAQSKRVSAQTMTHSKSEVNITDPDVDRACRNRTIGGIMLGRTPMQTRFSSIGPADYQSSGGKLPAQVIPSVKGGVMSLPLDEAPSPGPAPHDYQNPLKDRTPLAGGHFHPLQKSATGLDWWEMQRGPGKYGAPDAPQRKIPLSKINPLPSTLSRLANETVPSPGSAYYAPNDLRPAMHGVPFGALRAARSHESSNDGVNREGIPYLKLDSNIALVSTGFSFGMRTLTSDAREMIARRSEPGPQAYNPLSAESVVNKQAPRYTLGIRPTLDEDFGIFKGPGAATYQSTSGSEGLFGANRLSIRGIRSTVRFSERASTIGLPRREDRPSDVPAPDAYLLPTTNRGISAHIGPGPIPNEDLQMSPREKFQNPGPGSFNPTLTRKGQGSTIGGRIKQYKKKKHAAVVRRARLAMMRARATSAATWNG